MAVTLRGKSPCGRKAILFSRGPNLDMHVPTPYVCWSLPSMRCFALLLSRLVSYYYCFSMLRQAFLSMSPASQPGSLTCASGVGHGHTGEKQDQPLRVCGLSSIVEAWKYRATRQGTPQQPPSFACAQGRIRGFTAHGILSGTSQPICAMICCRTSVERFALAKFSTV